MIKIRKDNTILFGLSNENIKRLKQGMPIKFSGEQVGIPDIIFGIFYGETEHSIEQRLINAGYIIPQ